jgi:DNA-binding transcriptional MerR regulator
MYVTDEFTINELSEATQVEPRNIRFYIQQGVMPGPIGAGRGARYTQKHAEILRNINRWKRAGFSLERIKVLINEDAPVDVEIRPAKLGVAEPWTRVYLADGFEIHIDSTRAELAPEMTNRLIKTINQAYRALRMEATNKQAAAAKKAAR